MAVNGNIVSKPITISEVANLIGYGGNDLGTLCKHTGVNMWSRFKPVRDGRIFVDWSLSNVPPSGFDLSELWENDAVSASGSNHYISYLRPNSVYRLGDFYQYKNNAIEPYSIIKVSEIEFPNRFPSRVGISVNSVDSYNVQLSDVIPLTEDGWRLCALLTDVDYANVYWWWASSGIWTDSSSSERTEVLINTSSARSLGVLEDKHEYGIVLLLAKFDGYFSPDNTGYNINSHALPYGSNKIFVPSLVNDDNRFTFIAKTNAIFNDVDVYEVSFAANCEDMGNPQGSGILYNEYMLQPITVDVLIPSKYQSYVTNNVLKVRCVLFVDNAYDASLYEETESEVINKGLGSKAFDITDYVRVGNAIYNPSTGLYTFDFNSLRLPYLYTDYEASGTHKWYLSVRLTIDENDRIDSHPNEEIIWNSDEFDVALNGNEDVIMNYVRNE